MKIHCASEPPQFSGADHGHRPPLIALPLDHPGGDLGRLAGGGRGIGLPDGRLPTLGQRHGVRSLLRAAGIGDFDSRPTGNPVPGPTADRPLRGEPHGRLLVPLSGAGRARSDAESSLHGQPTRSGSGSCRRAIGSRPRLRRNRPRHHADRRHPSEIPSLSPHRAPPDLRPPPISGPSASRNPWRPSPSVQRSG